MLKKTKKNSLTTKYTATQLVQNLKFKVTKCKYKHQQCERSANRNFKAKTWKETQQQRRDGALGQCDRHWNGEKKSTLYLFDPSRGNFF